MSPTKPSQKPSHSRKSPTHQAPKPPRKNLAEKDIAERNMAAQAAKAADFMKGLASPHRLKILCALLNSEKSVGELMTATGIAQTSMSQHLSKLKIEGIVTFRRDHRTLYYSIDHPLVRRMIELLYSEFCSHSTTDLYLED